jgi:hypothetical protein
MPRTACTAQTVFETPNGVQPSGAGAQGTPAGARTFA